MPKRNVINEYKYKCKKRGLLSYISSYLVRDKCVICNNSLVERLKIKIRKILRKIKKV